MEWLLIALTSVLTMLSPVGWVVDTAIANNIRHQVKSVEELSVRVDTTPSWQLIKGKVHRVRIASRGLEPISQVRIDHLELETDPIDLQLDQLKTNNLQALRRSLRQPLQGAIKVVMTEVDINQALADPTVKKQIEALLNRVLPSEAPRFSLESATVTFLPDAKSSPGQIPRLQVQISLSQAGEAGAPPEKLAITAMAGIELTQGYRLSLIEPSASLNGRKISSRIINSIVGSFGDRLTLKPLEKQGITARVLNLSIEPKKLSAAVFLRLDPLVQADSSTVTQVLPDG